MRRAGLHARFEQVHALNVGLEAEVAERTAQLSRVARDLDAALRKQKELDELKTRFFTGLNHDLRSPLNVLAGSLKGLRKKLPPEPAGDHEELFELAQRSLMRLGLMIDDMMDLARVDAGRREPARVNVDMREPLRELLTLMKSTAESLGRRWHCGAGLAVIAAVDPRMIERVLLNLLSNALKFSEPGGHVQLGLLSIPGGVEIRVSDDGIGVTPEESEVIFERFHRGATPAARARGGTGLGLAVVKEFVELHHGHVTVQSERGKGATFVVRVAGQLTALRPAGSTWRRSSSRTTRCTSSGLRPSRAAVSPGSVRRSTSSSQIARSAGEAIFRNSV